MEDQPCVSSVLVIRDRRSVIEKQAGYRYQGHISQAIEGDRVRVKEWRFVLELQDLLAR